MFCSDQLCATNNCTDSSMQRKITTEIKNFNSYRYFSEKSDKVAKKIFYIRIRYIAESGMETSSWGKSEGIKLLTIKEEFVFFH